MLYRFLVFPDFKEKALTLSYDDGVVYDKKLIEIMQKHGLKGTFNINSELFAQNEGERRMTAKTAVELYQNTGMEIAVHGARHWSLAEVPSEMMVRDVAVDRENLEKLTGGLVQGMAYANGSYSDEVVEVLKKCGIKYSRTTVSTGKFLIPNDWLRMPATCHHGDPRLMELAKAFIEEPNGPYRWSPKNKLFYLWGHSYEFNDNDNWEIMEEFAAYMGGRNDVWYATNGEIYNYVQAYNRLEFSIASTCVHNPSSIDVYLDYLGNKIVVPAGKTVQLPKI
jgi:hypothetical protein